MAAGSIHPAPYQGGAAPLTKAEVEECIAAAIAAIPQDTISVEQLALNGNVITVTPGDGSAAYDLTITHPDPLQNQALIDLLTSTPHIEIAAGDNIEITGAGTEADPFIINGDFTDTDTDTDTRLRCTLSLNAAGQLVKTTRIFDAVSGEFIGEPTTQIVELPSSGLSCTVDNTTCTATILDENGVEKFTTSIIKPGREELIRVVAFPGPPIGIQCRPQTPTDPCDVRDLLMTCDPDSKNWWISAAGTGAWTAHTVSATSERNFGTVAPRINFDDAFMQANTSNGNVGDNVLPLVTINRCVTNDTCNTLLWTGYLRYAAAINTLPDARYDVTYLFGENNDAQWTGTSRHTVDTYGWPDGARSSAAEVPHSKEFSVLIPAGQERCIEMDYFVEIVDYQNPDPNASIGIGSWQLMSTLTPVG